MSSLYAGIGAAAYIGLVQLYRQRIKHLPLLNRYHLRTTLQFLRWRRARYLASITDSQQLVTAIGWLEFPLLNRLALEFALMRTFAIPSISQLLVRTKEFESGAGKRYDDTDLIITEILSHPPGHERRETAMERMNQIHGMYKISHEDYLYVLSTFVVEPVRFNRCYGLRGLTKRELDADVKTWTDMGIGMGLDVSSFTDYEAIERYHDSYEEQHMVYANSNAIIANATIELLLGKVPRFAHGIARLCLAAFMDDRLRQAVGLPKAPAVLSWLMHSLLTLRGLLCILLVIPTSKNSYKRVPDAPCPITGRLKYNFHVYEDTYPEGYKIEELGPIRCPVFKRRGTTAVPATTMMMMMPCSAQKTTTTTDPFITTPRYYYYKRSMVLMNKPLMRRSRVLTVMPRLVAMY